HGTPDITELPYDSVGALLAVLDKGYLSEITGKFNELGTFEVWRTQLKEFDENWNYSKSYYITSSIESSFDTTSLTSYALEKSNKFGFCGGGIFAYRDSGVTYANVWFGQINPDNGITVWDTLLPNDAAVNHITKNENAVIAVGATGFSNTGIKVWKINLPSIPFQTEFVSDEQDIPGKANQPQVTVYPNPSNNYYNLESGKRIKQVSVYNLRGSLIMQKRIDSKRSRVQLESAGVYLMRIEDVDGNITTKKVVKW
ncbi:T9SS type A sorting domain-containing protein, partial [Salibacter halophilus]